MADQIRCGRFSAHPGINKTQVIREHPIAEEHPNLVASFIGHVIRAVEVVGLLNKTTPISGKGIDTQGLC